MVNITQEQLEKHFSAELLTKLKNRTYKNLVNSFLEFEGPTTEKEQIEEAFNCLVGLYNEVCNPDYMPSPEETFNEDLTEEDNKFIFFTWYAVWVIKNQ